MKKFVSLIAAGSLALTLAACGGGEEATVPPVETNVEDIAEPVNVINDVVPEPAPSPTPTATPVVSGKEFDSSTTQEDAEATGMTSRVSRDEDNSSAPAQ